MNVPEFEQKYPEIAQLLPDGFWSDVASNHPLEFNRLRDNTRFLGYLSNLVNSTPATEITSQDRQNLSENRQFKAVLSEMIGYIATRRWLCQNPKVLDVKGTENNPEFACEDFDVEVARVLEEREIDRIRSYLEEELGGDCHVNIQTKPAYNPDATSYDKWRENEDAVDDVLEKIGDITHSDLPRKIETDCLRVEIVEGDADNVGYIGGSHARRIIPDENEHIPRAIRKKSQKCRGDRPLVAFLDLEIDTVDWLEELVWLTIGKPHPLPFQDEKQISPELDRIDSKWNDYVQEIGILPADGFSKSSAVPAGEEGVFSEEKVSCVAGVMVRKYDDEVVYIPNVFTSEVDAKAIFDYVGWDTDSKILHLSDI